jgi:histidine triad (HIT) family protein
MFDRNSPDIRDRMIAENEHAFAFLGIMPITPGHTLICPKRCVTYSHELHDDELKAIFSLKISVCETLKRALAAEGFNCAWNEGSVAGQTVPHFHLHIVPRKESDAGIIDYEPRVFLYRPGSRAISPHDELTTFAKELRDTLKRDQVGRASL